MRAWIALGLEVLGAAAIAVGVGLIYAPAGVITGALALILFGLALERSKESD